ncbi:helix-turn-helix domain-containing protein [Streptomyces sp. NPDC059629]|uniref:helix-turn-helix domain-containing protein n=1 Tax=Streptomyces sp. NPDC059629 TaxID=3346889 RepID=UPI0036854031
MESIPYPNNSRDIVGTERERYAKIAAERYAVGASIQVIADELERSRSFVNGLLHRDTRIEVRPRSVLNGRHPTPDAVTTNRHADRVPRGYPACAPAPPNRPYASWPPGMSLVRVRRILQARDRRLSGDAC